jgi:hypothetical protein
MILFSFSYQMEKENLENMRRYVMATILMPIEIRDLEEDDFVCLQDRAKVSLAFCKELPDIVGKGEGYGGLSEKIHDLFISSEKEEEKEEEKKGAIDNLVKRVDKETSTKRKKNITYRAFRENEKSHRYTFKHDGGN